MKWEWGDNEKYFFLIKSNKKVFVRGYAAREIAFRCAIIFFHNFSLPRCASVFKIITISFFHKSDLRFLGAFHIVSTPALSLRAIKTKFYDLLCRVEVKKAAIKCRWIAEDKRNYFVFTGLKLAFHLLYNLNLFIFVVSFEACGLKTGKMRKKT